MKKSLICKRNQGLISTFLLRMIFPLYWMLFVFYYGSMHLVWIFSILKNFQSYHSHKKTEFTFYSENNIIQVIWSFSLHLFIIKGGIPLGDEWKFFKEGKQCFFLSWLHRNCTVCFISKAFETKTQFYSTALSVFSCFLFYLAYLNGLHNRLKQTGFCFYDLGVGICFCTVCDDLGPLHFIHKKSLEIWWTCWHNKKRSCKLNRGLNEWTY